MQITDNNTFDAFVRERGWEYDNGGSYRDEDCDWYAGPTAGLVLPRQPPDRLALVRFDGLNPTELWSGNVSTSEEFMRAIARLRPAAKVLHNSTLHWTGPAERSTSCERLVGAGPASECQSVRRRNGAMRNPVVSELEKRILPRLEAMAAQLRREFPKIRINTWSSPTGSAATDNHAHDLGIDCLFDHAPPDEADNVALIISVVQIKRDPYLSDLSVCWGAGARTDCVGTDLLESPIPWSTESIARIEIALPRLFESLLDALRNPPFPNQPA